MEEHSLVTDAIDRRRIRFLSSMSQTATSKLTLIAILLLCLLTATAGIFFAKSNVLTLIRGKKSKTFYERDELCRAYTSAMVSACEHGAAGGDCQHVAQIVQKHAHIFGEDIQQRWTRLAYYFCLHGQEGNACPDATKIFESCTNVRTEAKQ